MLTPLLLLVWLAPTLAGVLDVGCWFLTNSQCTPIAWNEARVLAAFVWTCAGGFFASLSV